ncbi:retrotransposon protein, putative, ty1-copia subclass [Tanacetum coccineum]
MKDTSPSKITSEISMKVEGFELPPRGKIFLIVCRYLIRTRRAPNRLSLNVEAEEHSLGDLNEPTSYKAAMLDSESNKWIDAMNAEIQSMMDNMVWVLVDLPPGCKTVGSKWIFKKKTDMDGIVHTYKARLVAKGYTQLYGVDYEETFSPVADIRAITFLWYKPEVLLILIIPEKYVNFKDPFMVSSKHQKAGIKDLMRKSKVCLEAEYIAASEAAMEAVWIRKFISGLGIVSTINDPIKMFCDNSVALHFANEPGVQRGARYYHRRYHYVRESIALGEIRFLKVHTDDNLADPFTKALSKTKLTQHARSMGLNLATQVLLQWDAVYDAYNEVTCLILGSMTPELHRQFKNSSPYDMIKELKSMFEKQAGVERFDLIQTFHACKQEEGKPVAEYVLKIKGYLEQLKCLGYVLPQDFSVGLILNGITRDFGGFVRNYNMHNMGKTIGEIHALLIEYEKGLPKKVETPQVMMIKSGKIQKANKKSLKAKGKGKANGKGKDNQVYIPMPKNPKPSAKEHPAKDGTCHHYKEGFREERKLKQGALYLYVGNGVRAQVESIGSFDLVLPNGLVICLDNCHYAPSITRGVVSVHRLVENGFAQCFTDFGILISKNNVVYFSVIPSNGIYEIDMHNLVPNDNSIYNVSTKRAKHNLDSTYLCHCRLAHISKKHIEKLQQEGLLKSTDDESFDQCVSCLSGKMTRKSFPHRPERVTDLLGIIHTDVCGPLRHVSRQGASYFITFTDDYSRYGYVYLLKHKHEVFETFKVFKNEVENQLGKTIKALRSDRGGEYISQEFKDYLKACGIVQQLTPPYTPQHNGVSERRNRTLLDMVRSMMNLTTLPLSFWDYALESATRILNMVPTKKVDKTPYEICIPCINFPLFFNARLLKP